MGLFFAPIANAVLSAVPRALEGKASGANNTLRQIGVVFGVAVLGSVFAANGSYASPQAFVDGSQPAVWIGAAAVALAALVALAIPSGHARATRRTFEQSSSPAGERGPVPPVAATSGGK